LVAVKVEKMVGEMVHELVEKKVLCSVEWMDD
jgi:hypothetical protein